jgi:hypothetical protein
VIFIFLVITFIGVVLMRLNKYQYQY